jgi:hypothetical protein
MPTLLSLYDAEKYEGSRNYYTPKRPAILILRPWQRGLRIGH